VGLYGGSVEGLPERP